MDSTLMVTKVLNLDKTSWKLTKVGDLAKDISKRVDNPGESEYDRFVGLGNFVSGDIKIKTWETTENLASSAKAFKVGDILFARRNAYLRRASLVDFDGCCSGDAFVLRENHDKIVPGFLAFLMNSNALWDYANSNAAGTMSKRVKWRDLAEYEFLLPPKDQQEHLAKLLWAMDDVIESNLNSVNTVQQFYKTKREYEILKKGKKAQFVYNSRLKEDVNVDIHFDKLNFHLNDIKYGTSKKSNSNNKGVPVLGIPNVVKEKLSLDHLNYAELDLRELGSCKLKKGDIVIVRTNGNPKYTGKSALYDIDEGHSFASYLIKISSDPVVLDYEFLVLYLQSNTARRYFKRHATSTAGNYNINTETIKGIPVPIFSKDKQKEIVSILKSIEKRVNELEKFHSQSRSLHQSLINQVF